MSANQNHGPMKHGVGAYVIAGLSYIPLLGVPFGLAAVVMGLGSNQSDGKRLAAIGAGGIAFTVLLYGSLFYFGFVQRGGVYDGLRSQLAQSQLDSLVPSVEFYKLQYGRYPESLEALQESVPKGSLVMIYDATDMTFTGHSRTFYYERVGEDHYYLRGVGVDGRPFTADDIVPQFPPVQGSRIGLLIEHKL